MAPEVYRTAIEMARSVAEVVRSMERRDATPTPTPIPTSIRDHARARSYAHTQGELGTASTPLRERARAHATTGPGVGADRRGTGGPRYPRGPSRPRRAVPRRAPEIT